MGCSSPENQTPPAHQDMPNPYNLNNLYLQLLMEIRNKRSQGYIYFLTLTVAEWADFLNSYTPNSNYSPNDALQIFQQNKELLVFGSIYRIYLS